MGAIRGILTYFVLIYCMCMNPEIPETKQEETLLSLTKANHELLIANNELLMKFDRRYVRGFWFKLIWFAILIGLPIILLPYIMSTLMGSVGLQGSSSSSSMSETLKNAQETLKLLQNP